MILQYLYTDSIFTLNEHCENDISYKKTSSVWPVMITIGSKSETIEFHDDLNVSCWYI